MGLRKKERETSEADFWYNIKRYAKGALLDLELISFVASEEQLKEIYKPYTPIDYLKLDLLFGSRKKEELPKEQADIEGVYSRTNMARFLSIILRSGQNEPTVRWKEKLAGEIVSEGLAYLGQMKEFQGSLYRRLFSDIDDAVHSNYSFVE